MKKLLKEFRLNELAVGLHPFMGNIETHATVGTEVSVGNLLNRGISEGFGRRGTQKVVNIEGLAKKNLAKEIKLHPESILGEPYYTIRDTYTGEELKCTGHDISHLISGSNRTYCENPEYKRLPDPVVELEMKAKLAREHFNAARDACRGSSEQEKALKENSLNAFEKLLDEIFYSDHYRAEDICMEECFYAASWLTELYPSEMARFGAKCFRNYICQIAPESRHRYYPDSRRTWDLPKGLPLFDVLREVSESITQDKACARPRTRTNEVSSDITCG